MDFALRSLGAAQDHAHVSNWTLKPHAVLVRLHYCRHSVGEERQVHNCHYSFGYISLDQGEISSLSTEFIVTNPQQSGLFAWCFWILSIFAYSVAFQKYLLHAQHSTHFWQQLPLTTRPPSPLLPAGSWWAVTQLRTCSEPGAPKPISQVCHFPLPLFQLDLCSSAIWTS